MKRTAFKSKFKPATARKCANRCGNKAKFMAGLTPVCSTDCSVEYGLKKAGEKKEAEFKERKKAYMEEKRSTRLRAAKEACHAYIRERDKNELCVCCGEPLNDDYHAGHFMESGNYSNIRYDERNIHGQRLHCNMHKGGDSGEYEIRLRAKIGDQAVDELHRIKSVVKRWTIDELRGIERYYKEKLAELKESS
jgi:hypothetical protein